MEPSGRNRWQAVANWNGFENASNMAAATVKNNTVTGNGPTSSSALPCCHPWLQGDTLWG
jgi:hypothetical protein